MRRVPRRCHPTCLSYYACMLILDMVCGKGFTSGGDVYQDSLHVSSLFTYENSILNHKSQHAAQVAEALVQQVQLGRC